MQALKTRIRIRVKRLEPSTEVLILVSLILKMTLSITCFQMLVIINLLTYMAQQTNDNKLI